MCGAYLFTVSASFAIEDTDGIPVFRKRYGMKTAHIGTYAALGAQILGNHGKFSGIKISGLPEVRLQQKVHIGGIHITIGNDGITPR